MIEANQQEDWRNQKDGRQIKLFTILPIKMIEVVKRSSKSAN